MNAAPKMHHALEALDEDQARALEDGLWWVQGRKSIIRSHLARITALRPGPTRIMDIGCGSGGNLGTLAEFGEVVGIEPSPTLAERARARGIAARVHEAPAWEVGETATTGLFTMFDVLEHIEDDLGFLATLRKHAQQDHTLLLSVPACPFLFGEHDRLLSHYRRYSKRMLRRCLADAGYAEVSLRYYMFFPFPAACAMRLMDRLKSRVGIVRKTVDVGAVPAFINAPLRWILGAESALSNWVPFPTGLWLFAIARPKAQ